MFGRSQSGPGGLSINTTSANTSTGQSSLPPPSDGKSTSSLFGNFGTSQATNTSQPQQISGLFGSTSQPQQTGGSFGSNTQAGSNQQQQGSSLFGGNQNTQATGGGLFGAQQNQQQSGGLFGSSNAQQSQPQQGGGLFASLGQNQAQNQQPQTSLFGGLNSQTKPQSLFGSTQVPPQGQQATMQAPSVSLFSSHIGQSNRQQTIPGVAIGINELRPTTRFNDLQEDLQKMIEYVDNFILGQIRKQEECSASNRTIEDMSSHMPSDIEYCANSLDTMQQALENDAASIAFAKYLVKADYDDARVSFKVIQNLSLPQQFHHSALRSFAAPPQTRGLLSLGDDLDESPTNIVDYFSKQANEMTRTLDNYNRNIAEVEDYLKGVESNTMQQMQQMMFTRARDGGAKSAEDQVRELAAVLREFGNGIMGVATKVGNTRETIQEVMLGP